VSSDSGKAVFRRQQLTALLRLDAFPPGDSLVQECCGGTGAGAGEGAATPSGVEGAHLFSSSLGFSWVSSVELLGRDCGETCMCLQQELMMKKEVIGKLLNKLRLIRQRATFEGWQSMGLRTSEETINDILAQLLLILERLDEAIGKLCRDVVRQ